MRSALKCCVVLMLSAVLMAQAAPAGSAKPAKKKRSSAMTSEDARELREALAAQQQQIQQLQEEMRRRDQLMEQMQQALAQAQSNASSAQEKAAAAQSLASQQGESVSKIQGDLADVKLNQTNTAVGTQDEQKRVSNLEGIVGRVRFSGDVRVRQEDFNSQNNPGCAAGACQFRARERIRLRFGFEGKLNEDFNAGIFMASGIVTDPTSSNETLTNVFERKSISFDRGYITYNPQAHKWLTLTGGKFAYSWIRTNSVFDPDLNPEGFSEKASFDLKNHTFKNVTFTAMQLLFNEVAGAAGTSGLDSKALGGQVSTKMQLGSHVTMTPSFSMLNWRLTDAILNQSPSVAGGNPLAFAPPNTPTVCSVLPCTLVVPTAVFGPNGMTNCTVTVAGVRHFCSTFLYADFIDTFNFKTPWEKYPINLQVEYEQNLNAAVSAVTGTKQDKLYLLDINVGRQAKKNDLQFGYSWWRQEADSVIASFNESDQRAPTNILQNKLYANWKVRNNVTIGATAWIGRTLNTNLPNAVKKSGIAVGAPEPLLIRTQFDIIYTF